MKKILLITLALLSNIICFAQRGGTERIYEVIGLSDGDNIVNALKIGIPTLILGYLFIFLASKISKNKSDEGLPVIGCLGIIIIFVGIFFLLPLLSWVEYIFSSIISIGFALIVVAGIVYFIYSSFTKN